MSLLLILKVMIDLVCGGLFAWGGYNFIEARRYIMPAVLALSVCIVLHSLWLGLLLTPVMGTLCLGYFLKNQPNLSWLGRGLWFSLQSLVIGLGLCLTGHLQWFLYVPYVLIGFGLGATLYNLQQIIGDLIFGVALGLILYLIH